MSPWSTGQGPKQLRLWCETLPMTVTSQSPKGYVLSEIASAKASGERDLQEATSVVVVEIDVQEVAKRENVESQNCSTVAVVPVAKPLF